MLETRHSFSNDFISGWGWMSIKQGYQKDSWKTSFTKVANWKFDKRKQQKEAL